MDVRKLELTGGDGMPRFIKAGTYSVKTETTEKEFPDFYTAFEYYKNLNEEKALWDCDRGELLFAHSFVDVRDEVILIPDDLPF